MAIPILSAILNRKRDQPQPELPMPMTYYQPIPQPPQKPDADIILALTKNDFIPKEVLDEHWCFDPKTIALGRRNFLEADVLGMKLKTYIMEQENWNPRYKNNPDLSLELRKLEICVDDALSKSIDGYFLNQITTPINVTETRQSIQQGKLPEQEKKGGILSFIGLGK